MKLVVCSRKVESKHYGESINEYHVLVNESSINLSAKSTLGLQSLQFSERNAICGNHQECNQKEEVGDLLVHSFGSILKRQTQIDLTCGDLIGNEWLKVNFEEISVAQKHAPSINLLENYNENGTN